MSFNQKRGTTLVEVLVVIVVFLVGILAVVQIFPRGFQILTLTRKGAEANALARDESEKLKASPSELPEMILPVDPNGNDNDPGDATVAPGDLGPLGNGIRPDGTLMNGATVVGPWALNSGANLFRRIVGETHRVPAPRRVGGNAALYGGLLLANFGPVDVAKDAGGNFKYPFVVTGNDLSRNPSPPSDMAARTDLTATGMSFFDTVNTLGDGDFYLDGMDTSDPAVLVPTGETARLYRFTLSILVSRNGRPVRRTFRNLPITDGVPVALAVPATTRSAPQLGYPLARISLSSLINPSIASGDTYQSIYPDSIRVKRGYREVAVGDVFSSSDPFEVKALDLGRGLLLFNPLGYSATVDGTNGRQPLSATLDYTLADWRILREDFRMSNADGNGYKLALGPIKGGTADADGITTDSLGPIEKGASQLPGANHLVITDLETGGIVCEKDPSGTDPYLTVNKSLGLLNFTDADATLDGLQIKVLLPDGAVRSFDLQGRALRAQYMVRDEWSVQVMKAAANYAQAVSFPSPGEFYVGGTNGSAGGVTTRLYFPRSDAGQKVTIGEVNYLDASNRQHELVGQDFTIRFRQNESNPSIDLLDVDTSAKRFDPNKIGARDVRGVSLVVRTLWNPDSFSFGSDLTANLRKVEQWGRGYRRSTLQTYVSRGEETN